MKKKGNLDIRLNEKIFDRDFIEIFSIKLVFIIK